MVFYFPLALFILTKSLMRIFLFSHYPPEQQGSIRVALKVIGELEQRGVPQVVQMLQMQMLLLELLLLMQLLLLLLVVVMLMVLRVLMLVGRAARGLSSIDQIAIVFWQIQ